MVSFSERVFARSIPYLLLAAVLVAGAGPLPSAHAQEADGDTPTTPGQVAEATDFSIPSAPAFALLDVSPSNVHTPAYARDFKIDWVLNDDQLASNIAIQAAPIWIFGFENVSASDYRKMNPFLRQLSSTDVSIATAQQSGDRFLSAAVKVNVYNAADPLADADYTTKLSNALRFSDAQDQVDNQIEKVDFQARASGNLNSAQKEAVTALVDEAFQFGSFEPSEVDAYQSLSASQKTAIDSLVSRLATLHSRKQEVGVTIKKRMKELQQKYERENWNATRVDVAAGRVYQYDNSTLTNLTLTADGWGGWINGATGFGTRRFLATGMARAITVSTASADRDRYFLGLNLRYRFGSSLSNGFVEYIRRLGDQAERHEIAYGGSIDVTDELNVQFGLRTSYDDNLELRDLRPTIKVNGKPTDLLGGL